ncbi:MAG: winged helix-turn-helix domain-containing protein [Nanoarchaeota archaeon]|nr:winged helix-turn-helix domain-containing protein [Nanoarchaeota archaeon]
MAKKETFIMVSLEEDKAKKLAQVISNDTSRKILDHLASKKATETELAKELSIPISTVHYNLKALVDCRLVEADEFHYSEKGKEVLHYSLANKYVIIAPKGMTEGFKDKLKSLLPVGFLIAAGAAVIHLAESLFGGTLMSKSMKTLQGPITESVGKAAPYLAVEAEDSVVSEGARSMSDAAMGDMASAITEPINQAAQTATETIVHNQTIKVVTERIVETAPSIPYWFWFVIGAVSAVILYLAVDYIRHRKK